MSNICKFSDQISPTKRPNLIYIRLIKAFGKCMLGRCNSLFYMFINDFILNVVNVINVIYFRQTWQHCCKRRQCSYREFTEEEEDEHGSVSVFLICNVTVYIRFICLIRNVYWLCAETVSWQGEFMISADCTFVRILLLLLAICSFSAIKVYRDTCSAGCCFPAKAGNPTVLALSI